MSISVALDFLHYMFHVHHLLHPSHHHPFSHSLYRCSSVVGSIAVRLRDLAQGKDVGLNEEGFLSTMPPSGPSSKC